MARQGRYTKKVSKFAQFKRGIRRRWNTFKALPLYKKILFIGAPILAFLILTPLITYIYYYNDIADQERLMNRNNTGVVLKDRNGETFYSVGRAEHHDMTQLADISDNVKHALIASEDKDFYNHNGFSIYGIGRGIYGTITNQPQYGGGSTITQQLAKNTLLSSDQTFLRKYQELAISVAIEQRYSKDQILQMYLNSAFFGGTTFGIDEAAKFYFNKSAKDLDVAESAMLIGILPAPNAYSPTLGNLEYAKERQNTVLTRMVTNGYISEEQKAAALSEQLAYAPVSDKNDSEAPHFAEMVLEELYKKYGEEKVIRSGYQVTTTLDLGLQRKLQANISSHMAYIQANGGSNAAGVAIDPTSGEIRAAVGSADWNNTDWGKVNIVTTARQPGSSFKPIYYSAALANGVITPASIFDDAPIDINGYSPKNASKTYSGNISVRNALDRSLNIPSVLIMQKFGISNSVQAAKNLGIDTLKDPSQYGLSLALGSAEVPLLEMTNAYAAFANQGQQYTATSVHQINDKFDNTIYTHNDKSKEAISPGGAYLISSILSDNKARSVIFGSSLNVPGHTAAVKTGTTDDSRDAWTIGYTPSLAVGVWVGNNNNDVMLNGGSTMAGPIWVKTMSQALAGQADQPFPIPSTVVQKPVCYGTESLANTAGSNTFNEYFLASALPTSTCNASQKSTPAEDKTKEETPTTTTPTTNQGTTGSGTGDGNGTGSGTGSTGGSTGDTGTGTGSTGTGSGTGTGGTGNNGGSGNGNGTGTGTGGNTGTGGTTLPVNP
ncbi:MAG TPA: PBP1A family penicillin-binding protein [Candidatus Saccharimonadales bacterium]|nr:PBP1A family penicillin-binding protein [Candidatus Saccharimonadales bacterium]